MTTCERCHGTGCYLIDQTYGHAEIDDEFTPVQACDACKTIEDDGLAALAYAGDLGLETSEHYVRYFFPKLPDDDDPPGDWAVRDGGDK